MGYRKILCTFPTNVSGEGIESTQILAFFHQWVMEPDGVLHAVVELEQGDIYLFEFDEVRFVR